MCLQTSRRQTVLPLQKAWIIRLFAANGADWGDLTNGPNRIELDGHDGIDGVQYDGSGVESDDFDVVRCDRNSENAAKHQIANQHV